MVDLLNTVSLGNKKIEVVESFVFLGDEISPNEL